MADDLIENIGAEISGAFEAGIKKFVIGKIREHMNRPTHDMLKALAISENESRLQAETEVAKRLEELERQASNVNSFRERITAMVEDMQFFRVYANLRYETIREAMNDRRKMLSVAAGGLIDPDVPITQKARAERTLRLLDPDDVFLLRRLARVEPETVELREEDRFVRTPGLMNVVGDEKARERSVRRHRIEVARVSPESRGALLTSGCAEADDSGWESDLTVTHLGHLILQVLAGYEPDHA